MPTASLKTYSPHLYYFGLIILVSGLPISKFMMSISQMIVAVAWLLEGNYRERILSFFKNKIALMLSAVFFIHVLGLLYTHDFTYGLEDIRKKIPLFILPFLFSTMPALSKKQTENILLTFVFAVLFSTLISLSIYLRIYERPFRDIRDISIFISHIRLGLLICLSIFILLFRMKQAIPAWQKSASVLLVAWFIYFLYLLEALTAIGILLILSLGFLVYFLLKAKKYVVKISFLLLIISVCTAGYYYMQDLLMDFTPRESYTAGNIPRKTSAGNEYSHDFISQEIENGYYTRLFICSKELEEEWKKKSRLDINGKDKSGQYLEETLIRFLTSKGLRKDGEGVKKLNKAEVSAIERGIANVYYVKKSNLRGRLHSIVWELWDLQRGGNTGGHSLTMRFEFWKTAWLIIKDHPFTGVGTGDVKIAFAEKYKETNSTLEDRYRLRSHNQFLSLGVALGIPVMLFFIFTLVYPAVRNRKNLLYLIFSIIAFLSMLTEDTLETQAGVSFYAFFNAFFLFAFAKPQK